MNLMPPTSEGTIEPQRKAAVVWTPLVSVVLPVYNSENEVGQVLPDLENQDYRPIEIIVVDDGSTDGTAAVADGAAHRSDEVRVLRSPHLGASHARNLGASESKGEVVFFSESDCTYDPEYITRAVESLRNDPNAGAVCLTGAPLITRRTLATTSIDIENKLQHRLLNEGKSKPFYAWVYRKGVFERLGGFDEKLFQGEDRDLFSRLKRAGYSVAWVPGVSWRHKRDQTTRALAAKWVGRGRSRVLYSLKHRGVSEILRALGPFWALFAAGILSFLSPVVGAAVAGFVVAVYLVQWGRVTSRVWSDVDRKSDFVGYLPFLVIRNLSTGIGYTTALLQIGARRIMGKETTWNDL